MLSQSTDLRAIVCDSWGQRRVLEFDGRLIIESDMLIDN